MSKERYRRQFLTVPEVSEELNVSARKIWSDISDRILKTHRFGRSTRISRQDLDDYIRRSRD